MSPIRTDVDKASADFQNWLYDGRYHNGRAMKLSWIITAISVGLVAMSLYAVAAIAQVAKVEPVFFTLDKRTGVMDLLTALEAEQYTKPDALSLSYAKMYIELRHGYVYDTAVRNYKKAVKLSSGLSLKDLIDNHTPNSKGHPMREYGDTRQIDVRVDSISYLNEATISARFYLDLIGGNQDKITKLYNATVSFAYVEDAQLSLTDRLDNPLGFVVTRYQVSEAGVPTS